MGLQLTSLYVHQMKTRYFTISLRMEPMMQREFILTISPSMDILISSNLERLIYDISGRDSSVVNKLMTDLSEHSKYTVSENMKEELKGFYGDLQVKKRR